MAAFTADPPLVGFPAQDVQGGVQILQPWPQPNQFPTDPPPWPTEGGGGSATPVIPTTGQIWPRAKTNVVGGGTSWERATATITTASLNAAEQGAGVDKLAPGSRLYSLTTDVSARVRLYTTAAKRDADAGRLISTPPVADAGLVLDYLTTYDFKGGDLSPLVDGFDDKGIPDGVIPYLIDNMESVPNPVTVTLTFLRTE